MAAHYGTLYLDADEFKPYFKKLNQMNVPICVHHTPLPVEYNSVYKYVNLRRLYGRCVDQGTAVGRELFSGMFGEFPNLKMIHTMLGGAFFGIASLLVPKRPKVVEDIERFDLNADKFAGYLENNLFFDMAHAPPWGKLQLECAVKVLGADHILWGSSYPLRNEWLTNGVEFIKSLDISEKEKELVLGGNAARLFKIKG
jgi:predicted TIM-barrel fold metal-dependent hydrolase